MDPDFYKMANRYTNQDINSLLSEQALAQVAQAGINPFATHGALSSAQRGFGTIPAYTPHVSHMGSLQDPHLQTIAAQSAYKGFQPSQPTMLSDPYAGLRLSSQSNAAPTSKPLFTQDIGSQLSTIDTQKWGLSNFVSQNQGDLGVSDYSSILTNQLNPPPAHSSKTSSLNQRLPFTGDMFSRSTKSPATQQYDPRSQQTTPVSSQSMLFPYNNQQAAYQPKSDVLMDNSMSYEAVSPATTPDLSHQELTQQPHQQTGVYLSLQDLASISSTQQKLDVTNHDSIQKRPPPMIPDRQNKMQHKLQKPLSQQDLFNGSQVRQSPQQSPIGSPPLHMGSPQPPMPSSNNVQAPPPVQAPADSTTKPKKSRSKKKKETSVADLKQDNLGQNYNPHVLNSQDISQRGNSAEYNNQAYMQNNRNQQQSGYNSGNINSAQNIPMMTAPQNTSYKSQPQHSNYAKNVPSPNINQSIAPDQARSLSSQSPMLNSYQQVSPSNSQTMSSFTVSDALEMSRQAVFANQGIMDGYGSSDLTSFGMQDTFSHQLGMDNSRRTDSMFNGTDDGGYMNNMYGGQFVSPNNVLHMDVSGGSQSMTIDQEAFSNLMNDSYDRGPVQEKPPETSSYSLTVSLDASIDDDLSHLAQPVVDKKDVNNKSQSSFPVQNTPPVPQNPPAAPKPQMNNASGGTSFMDSYLSFIQGKKPETLSSMSSAIIQNKPQLPKYIPEPPRPKRIEPEINCDKRNVHKQSTMAFSDSDSDDGRNSQAVQKAISTLNRDNATPNRDNSTLNRDNVALNRDNDNMTKFTSNKPGGLTLKINLNKVKRAEENAKKAKQRKQQPAKPRFKKPSKEKKFGLKATFKGGDSSGEDREELVPARQTSNRKAKETKSKYKEDDDSDSDTLKPIRKLGEAGDSEVYDSDDDPAWTPFNVDNKKPLLELDPKRKRPAKPKIRRPSKSVKMSEVDMMKQDNVVELDSDTEDEQLDGVPPVTEGLQIGDFVMEKKDITNTETYPIWKIEGNRMLHKFELFTDNSKILHRSIPTFSSWLPNMRNGFKHIRVRQVVRNGDKEYVEVIEADRPKPLIDSKTEEKYEEHPLVNAFNVYLQTFLSQALEPGFLSAIRESDERFYLDALDNIDEACTVRMNEIDSKVKWKEKFKKCVITRPHIRELDRPNLKQFCQACESASQPAIKSVHLFGNPYDRFTLQEITQDGPQSPVEFMIGKTAAKYVKPYHNLYHFKYNLFKRCQAKVNILQDGSAGDNAAILDQCLHNRTWVLQLFEDLKQMLEKG